MNKLLAAAVIGWAALFASVPAALAIPDQYRGDSAIYGVQAPTQPNVLIIIDDSGSMTDSVLAGDYDPTVTYTPASGNYCVDCTGNSVACSATNVYTVSSSTDTVANAELCTSTTGSGRHPVTTYTPTPISSVNTSCGTLNPYNLLTTTGLYSGTPLKNDGTCGSGASASYASGNYINYLNTPSGTLIPKIQVAQSVVTSLISSTDNVKFGLMTYRQPSSGNTGGTLVSVTPSWSKVSGNTGGTAYTSYVQKMDTQFPSGYSVTSSACLKSPCTNRDALISTLSGLKAQGGTPIGEVLVEAGRSFGGCDNSTPTPGNCGLTAYGATVGLNSARLSAGYYSTSTMSYPNIIDAPCQKNYIVLVTDGMSTVDNLDTTTNLTSLCGTSNASTSTGGYCAVDGCACCFSSGSCVYSDTTGGSCSSSSKQCAAYPSGNSGLGIDNSSTQVTKFLYGSQQNISTFAIGFNLQGSDTAAIGMLTTATDNSHGHGAFYSATTQTDLSKAFSQIMAQIYQVNSSYVAPVVPSSPQNRTYSGNRVYMGFFEPQQNTTWFGNLKKYGIGTFTNNGKTFSNVITDVTGVPATWVDLNNDGLDDIYGTNLTTSGVSNGSFKSKSESFWNTVADAGNVNAGGAGSVLEALSSPITSHEPSIPRPPPAVPWYP